MKKILTLAMGLMMATLLMAADRRPTVILNSSRNFEVMIDGRTIVTNGRTVELERLDLGRHSIRVYELRRGYRGGVQKRLVSQSHFRLRGQDLMIRINQQGEIFTKERNDRFGDDRDFRRDRNDRDDRYDRDHDDRYRNRDYDREFDEEHGWRRN